MRKTLWLSALLVLVVPTLYFLARPEPSSKTDVRRSDEARASRSSAERNASAADLRQQRAEQKQLRATVDQRLLEIEGRLQEMEASTAANAPEGDPRENEPIEISEDDMAKWMNESLQGRQDNTRTEQVSGEIKASLARSPNLRVENVRCGDRFCRASFFQEDGEPPRLDSLFGVPPLTGEGFTVSEPDGHVAVYFAREGASLDDFRSEAIAAAAP